MSTRFAGAAINTVIRFPRDATDPGEIVFTEQAEPVGPRGVETQLDVFNLLNLLNGGWGIRRVATPACWSMSTPLPARAWILSRCFRFRETASPWTVVPAESAFQFQFGVAYRF